MPKNKNPTNLSQCFQIEDFFEKLAEKVIKIHWKAETVQKFQGIPKCLNEIDPNGVQTPGASVPTKWWDVADAGPFGMCY